MTKKRILKRTSRSFTYSPNHYDFGGDFVSNLKDLNLNLSGADAANLLKSNISGIGSVVGGLGSNLISGGLESGAGKAITNIGGSVGSLVGKVNPLLGGAVSAASGILGGAANALFGSKLNQETINNIEGSNRQLNTLMLSGNSDDLMNQWGTQSFGQDFSKSDIGKDGLFSDKASDTYKKLKREQEIARNQAMLTYGNAFDAADTQSDLSRMSNFRSDGGKIYIKPSKRGTFTAAAKRRGMGVQEFASKVLANKEDYSPAMVKKANFARNASKWKHSLGGNLNNWNNTFTNGVTIIGNGGTHEQNPNEGVQMGVDPQGIPNLVEEGEVIWNDYVFSNRLTVPDDVKEKYKLRGNKELTFADAAKQMQKESEERPNDPISKRGLESAMLRLQQAQETTRVMKNDNIYDDGGFIPMGDLGMVDYNLVEPLATPKINGLKINYEAPILEEDDYSNRRGFKKTDLRYAPVLGSAIGLGQNLFSKPDYTSANTILEAANQVGNYTPVEYTPIGNYLQYRPFDRNFYLNKLSAQAGATRRAIMNTISPSRNAALLAADYNAQGRLGDLARQAEEYNLAQRQAVEAFNRGTNQANAEMGLKAAMANQEAALKAGSSRLSGVAQAMAVRDAVDARRGASMSTNLTNLFDSLGNIGIDEMNRADRDFYIKHVMGANLPLEEYRRLYGLDAAKKEAKKRGFTDNEITKLFKNGGQLKKKRGGFTY